MPHKRGPRTGKSTLAAGIGLYMLTSDGEGGAEVYSVATKKDQAKIIWSEAKRMGLGDLYVVSAQTFGHMDPKELGLDAAIEFPPHAALLHKSREGFIL